LELRYGTGASCCCGGGSESFSSPPTLLLPPGLLVDGGAFSFCPPPLPLAEAAVSVAFLESAERTSPKTARLRLICWVSSNVPPSAPLSETRSEPAKSTKCNLPMRT
jgi:hypothetical protein